MEAMIFAAGLGTRMRPLTDRTPKALLPVRGRPLLEHVMDRLIAAGAKRLVINVCHHADQIAGWLDRHAPRSVQVAISREPDGPYDTGGGLVHAAPLFGGTAPIVLHAVDVLSEIPLDGLLAEHASSPRIATLAVQRRQSSRCFLFDDVGLMGWQSGDAARRARTPRGQARQLAFSGIQVIAPELLKLADRTGIFPIRDLYLDLAERGQVIRPFDATPYEWLDVGTPERLEQAEHRDW